MYILLYNPWGGRNKMQRGSAMVTRRLICPFCELKTVHLLKMQIVSAEL